MPIFEYTCDDCGTRFEKLVRRTETSSVACPSCGQDHLKQEYSTFSAHAQSGKTEAPMGCGSSMCGQGLCGSGACEMN